MKGMTVTVFRRADGYDCTNSGITSKAEQVTLIGPNIPELFEPTEEAPAMRLIERDVGFSKFLIAAPIDAKHEGKYGGSPYMFGGNFVYSSDDRFPGDHPIKVFDRME